MIALWTWREARGDAAYGHAMAERMESARRRDEADVYDFAARAYVEFEEVEDEGACYAFDLGDDMFAFVVGQQFYPDAGFPGLDFSLVYPLAADGTWADMLIDRRGPGAEPIRVVPAAKAIEEPPSASRPLSATASGARSRTSWTCRTSCATGS